MYQHLRSSVRSFAKTFNKAWKKRRKSARARVRRDIFAVEALECRAMMADGQDLVAFAQALSAAGVKVYGADWSPQWSEQRALFEDGAKFLNFVEITDNNRQFTAAAEPARIGNDINILTWVFADGTKVAGVQTLQFLSQRTGIAISTTNVKPSFVALGADGKPVAPGGTITVKAGSPLWIPLDGFDPQGGPLTYEITSSNSSLVSASRSPLANQSARITIDNFGEMVFEMFDHLAPRAAGRFEQLANSSFYNTTATNKHIVHRIAPSFVIQMGDPTNDNGTGGSTLGDFDDQFSFDLQHNRSGILSYAKGGDDTNDSQFFITNADPRFLDFNHSIFGVLVEGDSVRAGIQRGAILGQSTPKHEVVVSNVSIFDDTENSAMLLKAVSATATSGTSEITVRVTDAQGNVTEQKYTVQIQADTANGSPFIADPQPLNFTSGGTIKFNPIVLDVEGNSNFEYTAAVVSAGGGTATVSASGEVTVTPPAGMTAGQMQVRVGVSQTDLRDSFGEKIFDTQVFDLNLTPAAPTSVDLLTDTGISSTDNVTNGGANRTLSFTVSGVSTDAQVKLFANGREIAIATATGSTATFNVDADAVDLPLGPNVLMTAKQTVDGIESPASTALSITYDPIILDTTSTDSTVAEGNVPFSFDADNPEELQDGFRYRIVGTTPTGLQFNTSTGEIEWTPTPAQVGTHSFSIQAEDKAGNTKDFAVSINITNVRLAEFFLVATDLQGNVISGSIAKGQEFYLEARVKDLRADATGVEAAFFDVAFDSQFATVTGTIEHGDTYNTESSGTAAAGSLDEVGGKTTATNLAGQIKTLFRVKMRAAKVGAAEFTANIAEAKTSLIRTAPSSSDETTLDADNILFTGATLNVVPDFSLPAVAEFELAEDSAASDLDVLAQATKQPGVVLTLVSVSGAEGTAAVTGGKIRYTPDANFFGEDTFSYVVRNEAGDELTGVITVTVTNVNDLPVALDDVKQVDEDSSVTLIDVLDNDEFAPDPEETLRIKLVGTGDNGGTIVLDPSGNVIRYTPKPQFFGVETFTYVVEDGHGGEKTATVRVTVAEKNDPPPAHADSKQIAEDSTDQFIDVLANDTPNVDPNETLTIVAKTNGANGTVKLENGRLLYTPKANFRGTDTFTYTVRDSRGLESIGNVTVQVADSNDPPVGNDDIVQTPRNKNLDIAPLANDSVGGDTGEVLRIKSITQPATSAGKATLQADGRTIKFEPTVGFTGKATFTYVVVDPLGAEDTATIEVTVLDVAPSDLAGFVFIDLNGNGRMDANEPGLSGVELKLSGKSSEGATVNKTVTTNVDGRYKFDDLDPGDYEINETQPAFLTDGKALPGSIGTVKSSNALTVKIVNEDTHGQNLNFSEAGRKPTFIKLYELFGSTPRNSLMAAVQAGASSWTQLDGTPWDGFQNVSVSLSSDRSQVIINATTAAGVKVRDTVPVTDSRVRLMGKEGNSDLIRLLGGPSAFNLQPVANTAPSFTKGPDHTAAEDAAKQSLNAWAKSISAGVDEAGQTVSFDVFTRTNGVVSRTSPLFSQFPTISSNGTLEYTPAPNANGTVTLVVVAKDNGGTAGGGVDTSAEQTFVITITAVNDAPSFTKGPDQTLDDDDALAQSIPNWATNLKKGGGDDENTQTLTFDVSADNKNLFTVQPAIDATGKLTYTLKPNTTGLATVTVKLKDSGSTTGGGKNESDPVTFKITVTGENDPPVAVADTTTTDEGAATTISVLANDTDPEEDTLSVSIATAPAAAQGTAVVNADKTITFTPANDFSGTATFTYQVADGNGGVAVATVTVTVNNVNDAPVAVADPKTTVEDTATTIDVLANDTDADGNTLTVSAVTEPAHGTATIGANGVITYTPDQEFDGSTTGGTDTFQYTVIDGNGGTATGTVTVTITSVNDAPEIAPIDESLLVTQADTDFVFEDDTLISIDDPDVGTDELEVELNVSAAEGLLSLGSTAGIDITTGGDGQDETQIIFRGTLAEITAALNGLTFTPAAGFTGDATVLVDVSDLGGNGGDSAPQTDSAEFVITVEDTSAAAFLSDSAGFEDAVDDFMSAI